MVTCPLKDIHLWRLIYGDTYMEIQIWVSIYGYPFIDIDIRIPTNGSPYKLISIYGYVRNSPDIRYKITVSRGH